MTALQQKKQTLLSHNRKNPNQQQRISDARLIMLANKQEVEFMLSAF